MVKNTKLKDRAKLSNSCSGYSLLELLVSLSIVALLLFFAVPQFNNMLNKHQLENRASYILMSLKEAKLAAIKFNKEVFICRIDPMSQSCVIEKNKGVRQWSAGWQVFVDSNADKKYQSTDLLLKVIHLNDEGCSVTWNRGDFVSYYKFGILKGSRAGRFNISCGEMSTQLIINWVGRVRRI